MTVRFAVLVMIRLAACLWVVSQRGCAMAQQPSVVPNSATPPFLLARFDDDVYGAIPPRHHTPGQNHLTPQQLPALGEDLGPADELYIVPNHRQAAERSTVRLTPKNGATFRSAKPLYHYNDLRKWPIAQFVALFITFTSEHAPRRFDVPSGTFRSCPWNPPFRKSEHFFRPCILVLGGNNDFT